MLVLDRKLGETIHIGDNVVVTITEIKRGKVRVGITAPSEIEIMRGELLPVGPKSVPLVPLLPLALRADEITPADSLRLSRLPELEAMALSQVAFICAARELLGRKEM